MRDLNGQRILVAEDEFVLAIELADELVRRGALVAGPVATLARGLHVVGASGIDGAILDINLRGDLVFPLADELAARRIPFVFATGYDDPSIPTRFDAIKRCKKPCEPDQVVDLL